MTPAQFDVVAELLRSRDPVRAAAKSARRSFSTERVGIMLTDEEINVS